jgi:hypothetical protein
MTDEKVTDCVGGFLVQMGGCGADERMTDDDG